MNVKVYLQHTRTHLFYAGPLEWVATRAAAESFPSTLAALECAQRQNISDARLVLAFEGDPAGRMDLTIPLAQRGQTLEAQDSR